ncbi:hypothetical protein ACDX78_18705 [Virgibacillus oceani]
MNIHIVHTKMLRSEQIPSLSYNLPALIERGILLSTLSAFPTIDLD